MSRTISAVDAFRNLPFPKHPGELQTILADLTAPDGVLKALGDWLLLATSNLNPAAPDTARHLEHGDTLLGLVAEAIDRAREHLPRGTA